MPQIRHHTRNEFIPAYWFHASQTKNGTGWLIVLTPFCTASFPKQELEEIQNLKGIVQGDSPKTEDRSSKAARQTTYYFITVRILLSTTEFNERVYEIALKELDKRKRNFYKNQMEQISLK